MCGLVGRYQRLGESAHILRDKVLSSGLKYPEDWEQYVPPKRWYLPESPQGVTTHKNNTVILTALRTSHLALIIIKFNFLF
jgi:hypothetical protein